MINFDITCDTEEQLIDDIVLRVCGLIPESDPVCVFMDIAACHLNGTPLKLQELLQADKTNFLHDIGGINRHLDRTTGELKAGFLPRYYDSKKKQ